MLFVIDTGGSYRGARVATEFLGHSFVNCVSKEIGKSLEIYYVGNSISDKYITDSIEVAGERDFSISMISKSGTMTEPAIACGVSGCLLGVNPFTRQERGAAKNMFVLPGKPGYEVEPEGLLKRLQWRQGVSKVSVMATKGVLKYL